MTIRQRMSGQREGEMIERQGRREDDSICACERTCIYMDFYKVFQLYSDLAKSKSRRFCYCFKIVVLTNIFLKLFMYTYVFMLFLFMLIFIAENYRTVVLVLVSE